MTLAKPTFQVKPKQPWSAQQTAEKLSLQQAEILARWGNSSLSKATWSAPNRALTAQIFWQAFFRPRPIIIGVTGGSSTAGYGVGENVTWIHTFADWLNEILPSTSPAVLRNAGQPSTGTALSAPCMGTYLGSNVDLLFWEHTINDFIMGIAGPPMMNLWLSRAMNLYPLAAVGIVYLWDSLAMTRINNMDTAERAMHPAVISAGLKGLDVFSISGATLALQSNLTGPDFLMDPHHPSVTGHRMLLDLMKFMYIPIFLDLLERPFPIRTYTRPANIPPPPLPSFSPETNMIHRLMGGPGVYCHLTLSPAWGEQGGGVISPEATPIASVGLTHTLLRNYRLLLPTCSSATTLSVLVYSGIDVIAVQAQGALILNINGRPVDESNGQAIAPWLLRGASSPTHWYIPSLSLQPSSTRPFLVDLCCSSCTTTTSTLAFIVMTNSTARLSVSPLTLVSSRPSGGNWSGVAIAALAFGVLVGGLAMGVLVAGVTVYALRRRSGWRQMTPERRPLMNSMTTVPVERRYV